MIAVAVAPSRFVEDAMRINKPLTGHTHGPSWSGEKRDWRGTQPRWYQWLSLGWVWLNSHPPGDPHFCGGRLLVYTRVHCHMIDFQYWWLIKRLRGR